MATEKTCNTKPLISEDDIDAALSHLRNKADEAAQARANVKYMAEFLKSKRAELKLAQKPGTSNAAAEDSALADPAYLELLKAYKSAVEMDAWHSFKREAAQALIEAWRSQQANLRAEGKAY
jgi:hypothetical protein